jgi:hypothetical protein
LIFFLHPGVFMRFVLFISPEASVCLFKLLFSGLRGWPAPV